MRKLIISVLLISLLLSLFSCNSPSKMTWSDYLNENDMNWNKNGSLMKSFSKQNNVDIENLTQYEYIKFDMCFGPRNIYIPAIDCQSHTLQEFNSALPIELIKPIDENTIGVVYNLVDMDGNQTYAYVLFLKESKYFSKEDGVDKSGNYESWNKTGELYFVSDIYSSEKYESILIGDSFDKALKIDSSIKYDARYQQGNTEIATIKSYRLLSDGIMIMQFDGKTIDGYDPPYKDYILVSKEIYAFSDNTAPDNVSLNKLSKLTTD